MTHSSDVCRGRDERRGAGRDDDDSWCRVADASWTQRDGAGDAGPPCSAVSRSVVLRPGLVGACVRVANVVDVAIAVLRQPRCDVLASRRPARPGRGRSAAGASIFLSAHRATHDARWVGWRDTHANLCIV